ncbi:MAG: aromatic ring-hydroxylating oxygenase subunit alpha [Pseudomonadales bacterium]
MVYRGLLQPSQATFWHWLYEPVKLREEGSIAAAQILRFFGGRSIGAAHDVPNKRDIKPMTFAGVPLFLVRDGESSVRVFRNVCPHRGAQLVDKERNCRGNIICPYHSWAFDLAGKSVRTPHVGGAGVHQHEGVDPKKACLSEVRSALWYGLVFVNISGDAPEFEEFIAPAQQRIGEFDANVAKYDPDLSTEMSFAANWKLVVENFVESYHVPAVHPELERVNPMRKHYQILGGHSYIGQGGTEYSAAENEEYAGLPHRPDLQDGSCYEAFYIYPNLIFGPIANFCFVIIADPQSPGVTNERIEFIFYGDEALSGKYDELFKSNADFLQLVNSQDIGICEKAQKGRASPAYSGGIFVLPQEATSLHFVKLVAANILATDEQRAEDLVDLEVKNIYHPD